MVNILMVLLGVFFVVSSSEGFAGVKKYEWYPTVTVPDGYIVEVLQGRLLLQDGKSVYIPSGSVVEGAWGETGNLQIVGEEEKMLPTKLDVIWFSFTENTFYSGSFDFAVDRLKDLFAEGVTNPRTGEEENYGRIVTGLAPGGHVSVWLVGSADTVEVGTYKAEPVDYDWRRYNDWEDTREETVKFYLDDYLSSEQRTELDERGVRAERWDIYKRQYRWQPKIAGVDKKSMWITAFNGEKIYLDFNNPAPVAVRDRYGIPKELVVYWKDGIVYYTKIELDEDEVIAAYQKFSEGSDKPMELLVEISEQTGMADVFLKDDQLMLQINDSKVTLYEY